MTWEEISSPGRTYPSRPTEAVRRRARDVTNLYGIAGSGDREIPEPAIFLGRERGSTAVRSERFFQGNRARKQDVVLEMNVLVQVGLKLGQGMV